MTNPTPTRPEPTTPTREDEIDDLTVLAICEEVLRHESDTAETVLAKWAKQHLTCEPAAPTPSVTREQIGQKLYELFYHGVDDPFGKPYRWQQQSDAYKETWRTKADAILSLLQSAAVPASPAEIEFNQKLKFVLENLAAMASLYDRCKNKKLNIKYHDDDLVSVHLGDLRKARALLAYIKSAASPKVTTP